jgi:hypothetical protein
MPPLSAPIGLSYPPYWHLSAPYRPLSAPIGAPIGPPIRPLLGPVSTPDRTRRSPMFGRFPTKLGCQDTGIDPVKLTTQCERMFSTVDLLSFTLGNKNYSLIWGFWQISGRTWPRDPFQRVGIEKRCRTHPKLAPETNKAGS